MDNKLAELLSSLSDSDIREDYSGRNMYSKTTTALVTDTPLVGLLRAVLEGVQDGSLTQEDMEDIDIEGLRTDNMGRDSMVIY